MKKRKWIYVQKPYEYGIRCDKCKGTNIEWSEFEHMIWCHDCQIDTEGQEGIFDGPIPVCATELLGLSLARLYLKDGVVKYPHLRNGKVIYRKKKPDYMAKWIVNPKKS